MREETRADGLLFAVAGMTRHGKTAWLQQRIRRAARVLVWDPRGEYVREKCVWIKSAGELARAVRAAPRAAGRFALWAPLKQFPDFAEIAYLWCQLWPCVAVVEEQADVTSSGAGQGAWGELLRKGLFYGAHIYATTQRPQEVDKTTWGNATVKHCHRLDLPLDCEYMGRVLGIAPEEIARLDKLDWIERRAGSPGAFRGRVTFDSPLS